MLTSFFLRLTFLFLPNVISLIRGVKEDRYFVSYCFLRGFYFIFKIKGRGDLIPKLLESNALSTLNAIELFKIFNCWDKSHIFHYVYRVREKI